MVTTTTIFLLLAWLDDWFFGSLVPFFLIRSISFYFLSFRVISVRFELSLCVPFCAWRFLDEQKRGFRSSMMVSQSASRLLPLKLKILHPLRLPKNTPVLGLLLWPVLKTHELRLVLTSVWVTLSCRNRKSEKSRHSLMISLRR